MRVHTYAAYIRMHTYACTHTQAHIRMDTYACIHMRAYLCMHAYQVRHGDEKTLKAMLDEAPQYMDCRGAHGVTMLHVAARFGHVQIVEMLLLRGADVCAKDDKGKTPYDKAQAAAFEVIAAMLVPPVPRSAAAQRSATIEFSMQPSRPLETLEC